MAARPRLSPVVIHDSRFPAFSATAKSSSTEGLCTPGVNGYLRHGEPCRQQTLSSVILSPCGFVAGKKRQSTSQGPPGGTWADAAPKSRETKKEMENLRLTAQACGRAVSSLPPGRIRRLRLNFRSGLGWAGRLMLSLMLRKRLAIQCGRVRFAVPPIGRARAAGEKKR